MAGPDLGSSILANGRGLTPQICQIANNLGVSPCENTPKIALIRFSLELEANCQLDLPLAEDGIASLIRNQECWIEEENGSTHRNAWGVGCGRRRYGIETGTAVGYVDSVEDVEPFCQKFKVLRLTEIKPTRDAQVDVRGLRESERVALEDRKPVVAASAE